MMVRTQELVNQRRSAITAVTRTRLVWLALPDLEELEHPVHRVRVAGAEGGHASGEVVAGLQMDVEPARALLGQDADGGDGLVDEFRHTGRRGRILGQCEQRLEVLRREVG